MSTDINSDPVDVAAWRKVKRRELLGKRAAMSAGERDAKSESIVRELTRLGNALKGVIAFYYPFRGEVNLLALMEELSNSDYVTALPVVHAPRTALQFRAWKPGCVTAPTSYGVPEPTQGEIVEPDVFIMPLVGFDAQLYRLGYGGGFYDRTFAATRKAVTRIGVGFEDARIDTIYPQPFDIPMHFVITENGVREASRL
jgi:5-formyltetrahydrofolate cyclo-ligase